MVRTESPLSLVILGGLGWACAFAAVALAWPWSGDDTFARCWVFAGFGLGAGCASIWLRWRFDPPRHLRAPTSAAPAAVALRIAVDAGVDDVEALAPALATDTAPLAR